MRDNLHWSDDTHDISSLFLSLNSSVVVSSSYLRQYGWEHNEEGTEIISITFFDTTVTKIVEETKDFLVLCDAFP